MGERRMRRMKRMGERRMRRRLGAIRARRTIGTMAFGAFPVPVARRLAPASCRFLFCAHSRGV
jgi:hypothetical protein